MLGAAFSVTKFLESLRFVINVAKSQLEPVTGICYLGFIIYSVSMKLLLQLRKQIEENSLRLFKSSLQEQPFCDRCCSFH